MESECDANKYVKRGREEGMYNREFTEGRDVKSSVMEKMSHIQDSVKVSKKREG